MVDKKVKLIDLPPVLRISRQAVYQKWKAGDLPAEGRPAMAKWSDVVKLGVRMGIKLPSVWGGDEKVSNGKSSGKQLIGLDFAKISEQELADAKMRLEVEKIAEDIRKKRKDSGELVERYRVEMFLKRLSESVRNLYLNISDGFESDIVGASPAEAQMALEKRLEKYGYELTQLNWEDI